MKKYIIVLFFYQLIFCSCGNSQHPTDNLESWESLNAEFYDKSKTIGVRGFNRYDLLPDSIYFYAKYKSNEVFENPSFKSFDGLLNLFMSATKQEHYDSIFVKGEAPLINPDYGRGRYANDRLRLLSSIKFNYNKTNYELVKLEQSLIFQEQKTTEMFLFKIEEKNNIPCLLYTSPSPRD